VKGINQVVFVIKLGLLLFSIRGVHPLIQSKLLVIF